MRISHASALIVVVPLACGSDEAGKSDATSADTAAQETTDSAVSDTAAETLSPRAALEAALHDGAAILCERIMSCLVYLAGSKTGGSLSECTEREYETLLPVLDLPGVDADVAALEALAAELRAADCDTIARLSLAAVQLPSMQTIGTLGDGGACVHPYQCAGICHRSLDEPCGTCGPPNANGEACTNVFDCQGGATCLEGTCVAFGEQGDACDATLPCFPHDACLDGRCAAALQADAPCTSPLGQCDLQGKLLVCDPATDACVSGEWANVGDTCGFVDGKAIGCSDSACLPSPLLGTCLAYADDGAACDPVNGPLCRFHASCIEGACVTDYGHTCE